MDLHIDTPNEKDWGFARDRVKRAMPAGIDFRISLTKPDVHDHLSLASSNWIAVATFFAMLRGPLGATADGRQYLAAKTLILLNRIELNEKPRQCIERLDTAASRLAFRAKMGECSLEPAHHPSLLSAVEPDVADAFRVLRDRPGCFNSTTARILQQVKNSGLSADRVQYVIQKMLRGK
ncbi:MAG: hypothetical protein ACRDX9_14890 [Acidimicrobiia bacterium]